MISQSQLQKTRKRKRDLNTLQVLGRRVTEDIVECVALVQKTMQFLTSVQPFPAGMKTPGRRQPEHRSVRPGHHLPVKPVAQPAAAVALGLYIRGQRDPGKDTPDINIVGYIQMTEYLCNGPFIR